jgi:hypothetical protein
MTEIKGIVKIENSTTSASTITLDGDAGDIYFGEDPQKSILIGGIASEGVSEITPISEPAGSKSGPKIGKRDILKVDYDTSIAMGGGAGGIGGVSGEASWGTAGIEIKNPDGERMIGLQAGTIVQSNNLLS